MPATPPPFAQVAPAQKPAASTRAEGKSKEDPPSAGPGPSWFPREPERFPGRGGFRGNQNASPVRVFRGNQNASRPLRERPGSGTGSGSDAEPRFLS